LYEYVYIYIIIIIMYITCIELCVRFLIATGEATLNIEKLEWLTVILRVRHRFCVYTVIVDKILHAHS